MTSNSLTYGDMKKVVRIVWISALTGLAFLSACITQNGLTRKERKQLRKEREQVEMQLAKVKSEEWENPVEEDPNYYRYYWPEFMNHFDEKYSLENRLDSINYRLGEDIDLDRNVRRRQILKRIDSLDFLIKAYIPPCVYGPPPGFESGYVAPEPSDVIWERQLKEAKKELNEFDRYRLPRLPDAEVLYGSPSVRRQIKK